MRRRGQVSLLTDRRMIQHAETEGHIIVHIFGNFSQMSQLRSSRLVEAYFFLPLAATPAPWLFRPPLFLPALMAAGGTPALPPAPPPLPPLPPLLACEQS